MPSFFRLVWAVMIGVSLLGVILLGAAYLKWGRGPSIEKESILYQPVAGSILEYPVGGFTSGLFASSDPTLHSILGNLDKAVVDDRVTGVLLVLNSPGAGYGMLEEMRAGIQKVRDAGKPVWAWSDNFSFKDLYLAAACDSFFIHPTSYVYIGGFYAGRSYVAGSLEKLGIDPEIHRIARFKSAAELVMRTDMSDEAREMTEWILNDAYPRVIEATAEGFGVETETLIHALERALPMPDEVVEMGLAHGVRYWDEMKEALPHPKGSEEPRFLSASTYAAVDPADVGRKGKKKVAVVHAQGLITGGKSGRSPILGVVMGYLSVNRDLKKALDDEDVVGVVLRVDSGGGEGLNSTRMSRMVEVVDREKPVVVSMVDVAASGGYTISYRARQLMANPNTITGSIGSITGKANLKGFYNKLGITMDGVGIGPNPDFYSDYRNWTPEEYAMVSREHWESYNRWITSIGNFRDMSRAEVDSVARGRVWTGAQAVENGLIDKIGNLDAAVMEAKLAAGLDEDEEVTVLHLPEPEGFLSSLLGMELSTAPEVLLSRWVGERIDRATALNRSRLSLLEIPVP